MRSILPFVLIVIFGAVAIWMRKLSPKAIGRIALALAAIFLVFFLVDPDYRYTYALFFVLACGIGLQKLGRFRYKNQPVRR